MPYRISPLLSLMADVNGAQTMPSIFDSAVRKSSVFGKLCYDAPKIRKNLDTWDSLSRESSAYEEILRVVVHEQPEGTSSDQATGTNRISKFGKRASKISRQQ